MTLAIGWLHDGGDTVETWLHQAGDWHATANSAAMSAAAGSPAPNKADELVEFASPRSDLAPRLHTNADSRNSYAHGAADHVPSHPNTPSATAPEPPAVPHRTRRPHVGPRLAFSKPPRAQEPPSRQRAKRTPASFRATAMVAMNLPRLSSICAAQSAIGWCGQVRRKLQAAWVRARLTGAGPA